MHIPFRNSPLTKILRSSLGGNSRTAIILCVNPCFSQYEQTMSTIRFGLNAKKIENQIKRNIITTNNDEIIKNLILEYEQKLTVMEKEKNEDKSRSQNLLNIIESLQQQKMMMEERLIIAKKAEKFNEKNRVKEVLVRKKLKNHVGDYIHYKNIGILHVFSYQDDAKTELKFDSQGKYALEALKLLQNQEKVLVEKEEIAKKELNLFKEKYASIIEKFNHLETKLTKKKNRISELTKKNEQILQENKIFSDFFELIDYKNLDFFKKFSLDFLDSFEKNLLSCLETIKFEKVLRLMAFTLQNSEKNLSAFTNMKENSSVIIEHLRESQPKMAEFNIKNLYFKEMNYKPMNNNTSIEILEKPLESSSMCSNFKELLSQINIRSEKNIDSFQTYFDKEHKKDSIEIENSTNDEGFETKLAELQKNFNDIKEKIKEKVGFSQCEPEESDTGSLKYNLYHPKKLINESLNGLEHHQTSVKENSPIRGYFMQNKENLNFSRREPSGKEKSFKKVPDLKNPVNQIKKNLQGIGSVGGAFEKHLEILRSNNKNP